VSKSERDSTMKNPWSSPVINTYEFRAGFRGVCSARKIRTLITTVSDLFGQRLWLRTHLESAFSLSVIYHD
jgi:hypothetical protein